MHASCDEAVCDTGKKGKLADDVSAISGPLTIALAIVTVLLLGALGVLAVRARRTGALARAATQFETIIQTGRYTERLRAGGSASAFADKANLLLEQIAMKNLMVSERERSLVGLLGGLNEAIAVHREHIVFANEHFAAMVGASVFGAHSSSAAQSAGQLLIGKIPTRCAESRSLRARIAPAYRTSRAHRTVRRTHRLPGWSCVAADTRGNGSADSGCE